MKSRALLIALLGAFLALAPFSAVSPASSAASSVNQTSSIRSRVGVDVGVVEVKANPGASAGDSVKLTNKTSQELSLAAVVTDLGANADGDLVAVEKGTGQRSAISWITVTPSKISLPGNGVAFVSIKVAVPKGTEPGGYYTAVTFDTDGTSRPEQRVSHAILVNVLGTGSVARARLVSFSAPAISVSGKVTFQLVVENIGTVHAIGGGTFEIRNFGLRVSTLTLPPIIVLPQVQRLVRITLDSPPVAGRLTADATVKFSDGSQVTGSASGFVLIWWLAIALAAVLLLFVVSLLRLAGVMGPKAAKRHSDQEAAVAASPESARARKLRERQEQRVAAVASKQQASEAKARAKAEAKAAPASVPSAAPVAPARPVVAADVAAPARSAPDKSFWDKGDKEHVSFEDLERNQALHLEPAADDLENEEEAMLIAGSLSETESQREAEEAAAEAQDDGFESAWAESAPAQTRAPRARPVAVSAPRRPGQPSADLAVDPGGARDFLVPVPPEEELRPAGLRRRDIQAAILPPLRNKASLPDSPPESLWSSESLETKLERPTGSAGPAMALRRMEVALRMINGKTGETGAILDAGLDLLYSVRSDAGVVAHLEGDFAATRNRRKLGPLALALFAVDSHVAAGALLDAYASAPKMVADRIRRAILACDPADVRRHRDLLNALPPARRDSLGL